CKLKLPGRRTKTYGPDSSIRFPRKTGAKKKLPFPFFILEAAVSQPEKKLATKVHRYVQGSRGYLKYLCLLRLYKSTSTKPTMVTVEVIQPYRVPTPTSANPTEWIMEQRNVVRETVIYPRKPTESFTISLDDTLPKGVISDSDTSGRQVTIPLQIFHARAEVAITEFDATASNASSSFNRDQRRVSTPPDSETELFAPSEDELDDSDGEDPTYEEGS
ncbi:MAG: hypothetical protein Q9220_007795, partial [cf. Caloplaca sp. 1 TL-2023]